jgi:hypothetical protein
LERARQDVEKHAVVRRQIGVSIDTLNLQITMRLWNVPNLLRNQFCQTVTPIRSAHLDDTQHSPQMAGMCGTSLPVKNRLQVTLTLAQVVKCLGEG